MRKLHVVLVCALATGWLVSEPALGQTDLDNSRPFQGLSARNQDNHSHVVPIGAIGVPGTSDANPFVNFDQARVDIKSQLLFVSSRSSKAVAILDALTDRKVGETHRQFSLASGLTVPILARTETWSLVVICLLETIRVQ